MTIRWSSSSRACSRGCVRVSNAQPHHHHHVHVCALMAMHYTHTHADTHLPRTQKNSCGTILCTLCRAHRLQMRALFGGSEVGRLYSGSRSSSISQTEYYSSTIPHNAVVTLPCCCCCCSSRLLMLLMLLSSLPANDINTPVHARSTQTRTLPSCGDRRRERTHTHSERRGLGTNPAIKSINETGSVCGTRAHKMYARTCLLARSFSGVFLFDHFAHFAKPLKHHK